MDQSTHLALAFGAFQFDARSGELRKDGKPVSLQGQPCQILEALLATPGRLVTRDELRACLWPGDTFVDFDHSLNIAVSKLRDALDDRATSPHYIETVPRRGYRFVATVAPAPAAGWEPTTPAEPTASATVAPVAPFRGWLGQPQILAAAALMGVTLAAVAGWRMFGHGPQRPRTIAVLPLQNIGAEVGNDDLADGLTVQLIADLSSLDGLEVRPRTSSFEFKNREFTVAAAGAQLHADLLLEGSLRRERGRFRLDVALVRVADDVTLWSGRYDRDGADMLAVQDEISRSIVNELRLKGVGGRRRYNIDPATYDLFLQAQSLTGENAPGFSQKLARAFEILDQVTQRAPTFAPAYAAEADSYAHSRNRGRSVENGARMRSAVERALELDPLLPEAIATLGIVQATDLRWADAEASFRKAIALNPSDARSREDFALIVLMPEGRDEEALAQVRRAAELDPLSPTRMMSVAFCLIRQGQYAQAIDIVRPLWTANPSDEFPGQLTARALLASDRSDEALAILEQLGPGSHGYLGYAYGKTGRIADAIRIADEDDPARIRHRALVYASLGNRDRCLEALRALADSGDFVVDLYLGEPEFAFLRSDPRWQALRRDRRLPE